MLLLPFLTMNWVTMDSPFAIVAWLGLVVLLFGSVLLHELGHALTARRFGINTHDIVLTPIGGMARVADMPDNPKHEIAIAIAGPLVSLVIAGIAFLSQIPLFLLPVPIPESIYIALYVLTGANFMLGLFNLAPALPMDGGRVLRGILALKRDYLTATRIAAKIGRVLAIVGGIYALYHQRWTLAIIAVFIYMAAGTEVRMAALRAYRQRAGQGPFGQGPFTPPGGSQRNGNVWTWTYRTGQDYPSGTPQPGPFHKQASDEWTTVDKNATRDVISIDGTAEVISRKDPDNTD